MTIDSNEIILNAVFKARIGDFSDSGEVSVKRTDIESVREHPSSDRSFVVLKGAAVADFMERNPDAALMITTLNVSGSVDSICALLKPKAP